MVSKFLIFRTDRIGDLLLTCPAILAIKEQYQDSHITLVASKKNKEYAEGLKIFNKVILFPEKNLTQKIKFIFNLLKFNFDSILVFDGKDRSIISSLFIKSKNKVALIPSNKHHKFWKFFNIKFIKDDEKTSLINMHEQVLLSSEMKKNISKFNFLKYKKDNEFSRNLPIKNYIHLHLDEKFTNNLYISTYTNFNITYEKFTHFIDKLLENNNVIITSGLVDFFLLNEIKSKFTKINEKIYFKNLLNNKAYFIYKPSFDDLESLLRNAKLLISCHGAIIHAANSLNIKIFDILEKSKEDWYIRFNAYLKKYKSFNREDFSLLHRNIIKNL